MKENAKPWGCKREKKSLYKTKERRKLIYNFFLLLWSKGGSRELLEVSTLPRDLAC